MAYLKKISKPLVSMNLSMAIFILILSGGLARLSESQAGPEAGVQSQAKESLTGDALGAINTRDLLVKMDDVLRGKSHDMTVSLDVKTSRWQRSYTIHVQMKGIDYTFCRVLKPAKSEGQGFLRLKTRLWQYLPTAERTILIPPSLMLDDFMGSDFSNDDFVKMSYMADDYKASMIGEETLQDMKTYHLSLLPSPDAPVTYGKLEVWLRQEDSAPVRWDFYNEKMEHIRTLNFSDFKSFEGHVVPALWTMENLKDQTRRTVVTIHQARYDVDIPDSVFTRQKLERYP